jgi:aldehyde dehydrogenase (NAD+)
MSVAGSGPAAASTSRVPERVADLRATFESGRTREVAWRREQLTAVEALLNDREPEIAEALWHDLRRHGPTGIGSGVDATPSDAASHL